MRSIRVDDQTTRARIRDAAIEVFGRDGFATGVRAIATAAGVSPGLVNHHFGSKNGLRQVCDGYVLDVVREICDLVSGPVSAEVTATDHATMLKEGQKLAQLAGNIAVKVPLTWDGLKACRALSQAGTMVNVTLCFSANQALLAAKAGATFISPFIGRLDDINIDGMELISEIRTIYDNYGYETKILAASIRHTLHLVQCALVGADVATVPFKVLSQMMKHPLTDKGLEAFLADWHEKQMLATECN